MFRLKLHSRVSNKLTKLHLNISPDACAYPSFQDKLMIHGSDYRTIVIQILILSHFAFQGFGHLWGRGSWETESDLYTVVNEPL